MTSPAIDKHAIARNFSIAAAHYDTWAGAQGEIALSLFRLLPETWNPAHIVDAGCGTGLLSAHLLERYPEARFTGMDIAPGMIEACARHWGENPRATFITGDAEDPAMIPADADLMASSCVAQWFADAPGTIQRWAEALRPGGLWASAMLIQGSFCELHSAYRDGLNRVFHGLDLPAGEDIPERLQQGGLTLLHRGEAVVYAWYPSSREALRSFHQIGAVFQGQPDYQPLTMSEVRRLLAAYDAFADPQGRVPVAHAVQYIIAEKKV